jgi:hypothetical protein
MPDVVCLLSSYQHSSSVFCKLLVENARNMVFATKLGSAFDQLALWQILQKDRRGLNDDGPHNALLQPRAYAHASSNMQIQSLLTGQVCYWTACVFSAQQQIRTENPSKAQFCGGSEILNTDDTPSGPSVDAQLVARVRPLLWKKRMTYSGV